MNIDSITRFRHDSQTFLNHILGYISIIEQELPQKAVNLQSLVKELYKAGTRLKEHFFALHALLELNPEYNAIKQAIETINGAFFSLITTGQLVRIKSFAYPQIQEDAQHILDSANRLYELTATMSQNLMAVNTLSKPSNFFIPQVTKKETHRGRFLIIDDDPTNLELLSQHLERQGHVTCQAQNAADALNILKKAPFDIILLDLMMPGSMNGLQLLEFLKTDEHLRDIAVIVISSLEDPEVIAGSIELGADDFMPRNFDQNLLKARINNILEKKEYKKQSDKVLKQLMETQAKLAAELRDAASYVHSILPRRSTWKHVRADWVFIPSLSLGGDSFYYQPIDNDNFMLFLIDVSGHGIEAALLSITIMNILRSQALGNVDFKEPASVLSCLNTSFRLEEQNNMFFTIWYGVYNASTRTLTYASGGSPPAILAKPDGSHQELSTDGVIIGVDEQAHFVENSLEIDSGSTLFLFSDGIYEVHTGDKNLLDWDEFLEILKEEANSCCLNPCKESRAREIISAVRSRMKNTTFNDDVSLMEFSFYD